MEVVDLKYAYYTARHHSKSVFSSVYASQPFHFSESQKARVTKASKRYQEALASEKQAWQVWQSEI